MPVDVSSSIRPINGMIGMREDTTVGSIILYNNSPVEKQESGGELEIERIARKVMMPLSDADATITDDSKISVSTIKLDGENDFFGIFNNFLLTNVTESRKTISKVHLNFGDSWNVFFFGNSPVMVNITGGLIDTEDFPYYQEFMTAYSKFLSGDKLISGKRRMMFSYDGKVIDGFIMGLTTSTSVGTEQYKTFQMSILVRESEWIRFNKGGFNKLENKARMTKAYPKEEEEGVE